MAIVNVQSLNIGKIFWDWAGVFPNECLSALDNLFGEMLFHFKQNWEVNCQNKEFVQ